MIGSALFGLWRLVGLRGLIVGTVVAFAAYWHFSAISEAYDEGAQSVRLQWQEANRRAELAAIAKQKKQQAEISRIEAELLAFQTEASIRREALEEALAAERADNEKSGVDLSVCRLPDRMRNQLIYR